jgi:tRNA nucleotidyltransferase (CCA-adding enzyme)
MVTALVEERRGTLPRGFRPWLAHLAALVRNLPPGELASLVKKLGMAPAPARTLVAAVAGEVRLAAALNRPVVAPSAVRREASRVPAEGLILALAGREGTPAAERVRDYLERLAHVRPLLNGADLGAMGHRPGPDYTRMLAGLLDAQLDGKVADREAAMAWVKAEHPVSIP